MKNVKIGFVGAGGTGKSSVAKELAKRLGMPLIGSPSRSIFEKHGVRIEDDQLRMTAEDRLALQMDIFLAINSLVEKYKHGIFERTVADNFFYLLFRCHDIIQKPDVLETFEVAMKTLCTFNVIYYFYLPKWDPDSKDMRSQSYAPRLLFDLSVRELLNRSGAVVQVMIDGTVEERVRYVIRNLKARELING